ncbi:MAG: heme-binding domain-containing protein [Adhaeribacter sp.]
MNLIKKILLGLLGVFVFIQLFRPQKNKALQQQPKAIRNQYVIPARVESSLRAACFDCHSNNTKYPWYAEVQPIAWYLEHHIKEGKTELNFDEFLTYSTKKRAQKLEEIIETQEEGSMPLSSYIIIHQNAKLTQRQKQEIINWAKSTRQRVNLAVEAK